MLSSAIKQITSLVFVGGPFGTLFETFPAGQTHTTGSPVYPTTRTQLSAGTTCRCPAANQVEGS